MLESAGLTIIPSLRRDYFHCCAFPVQGRSAWPVSFSGSVRTPLLIEYDLGGGGPEIPGWRTVDAQRTPEDVSANLSLLGEEASPDASGVPIARSTHLVTRPGQYVHHLTAAVPADGVRADTVWQQAAATVKRTLVPETWVLLGGCDAIFHFMDDEFAYFLSPDRGWCRQWVEDVISARFPLPTPAQRAVASWVLESFEGSGGRLHSVQLRDDGTAVEIRGIFGCDLCSPIQLGIRGGAPFEVEIPLFGAGSPSVA